MQNNYKSVDKIRDAHRAARYAAEPRVFARTQPAPVMGAATFSSSNIPLVSDDIIENRQASDSIQ